MANPFQVGTGLVTGAGTSRSVAVASATAPGDTLLVTVAVNNTSGTVSACTDSQGNVYSLDRSFTSSAPMMYQFRSPGATGGSGGGQTAALSTSDMVTITTAGVSANTDIYVSDAPGVGSLDSVATIATGSSGSPSVSVTPTNNNEILVGALVTANSGGAPSVSSPFTSLGSFVSGSNPYDTMAYDVLSGGSGVAQTFAASITSANWRAGVWAFNSGATPVSLPDEAAAVDSIVITVAKSLADVAATVDSVQAGLAIPAPDVAGAVDSIAPPAVSVPLAQAGGAVDSILPAAAVPLGDTSAAVDSLGVNRPVALSDVAAAFDIAGLTLAIGIPADAAGAVDSISHVVGHGEPLLWSPLQPVPGNVLWGTGLLLTARVGTPVPADSDLGKADAWLALGWAYVGATDSGVTHAWNPSSTAVPVETSITPAGYYIPKADVQLTTSMAEETLDRIALAWGNSGTITGTPAFIGQPGKNVLSLSGVPQPLAAALIGQNQQGYPRVLVVPSAQSSGQVGTSYRRASGARLYPLTITATCPLDEITWTDLTSPATS